MLEPCQCTEMLPCIVTPLSSACMPTHVQTKCSPSREPYTMCIIDAARRMACTTTHPRSKAPTHICHGHLAVHMHHEWILQLAPGEAQCTTPHHICWWIQTAIRTKPPGVKKVVTTWAHRYRHGCCTTTTGLVQFGSASPSLGKQLA